MSSIELRQIAETDTELIVRWRNSDAVKSWFIQRNITEEMHINWLHSMVFTGKVVQFIIEYNGFPVGSTYLRDIDRETKSAEFGIFIGEEKARGIGCGTEVTRRMIEYGFLELKLHRIFLRVLANNHVAINSYYKAGFSYEGTAKDMVFLDGKYADVVFMSIINGED